MIKVGEDISFEDIETSIEEIQSGKYKQLDLELLHRVSHDFPPGIVSSILQMVCTWTVDVKDGKMILPITNNYAYTKFLSEIYCNPSIATAFLMNQERSYYSGAKNQIKGLINDTVQSYSEIENVFYNRNAFLLQQEIQILKERIEILERPSTPEIVLLKERIKEKQERLKKDASKSREIIKTLVTNNKGRFFLATFDHISRLKYPRFFYSKSLEVQENSALKKLIETFFKLSEIGVDNEMFKQRLFSPLSDILYELFDNTDSWAKIDFKTKKEYPKNYRGINFYVYKNVSELKNTNTSDPIQQYINQLDAEILDEKESFQLAIEDPVIKKEGKQKIGLCEVSVLDAGPGLASRWTKKDLESLTHEKELDSIFECFKKNLTSDYSSSNSFRGHGLSRVIKIIGQKGFVRVRTGRLFLYRNFYDVSLDKENEINNGRINFKNHKEEYGKVRGTLISIFYPFLY